MSDPIFLFEPSPGLPLVSIVVSLRTGAAHDDAAHEGLARMTARLVRRGTKRRVRTDFDEAIEGFGFELALDVGSSTTTFAIQVLSKHADAMTSLLCEMFSEPLLDEAEFDRLKRESLAELLEARDSDRSLAQIAMRRQLFGSHVYGRSAAGRLSTVEKLTIEDVRAFHKAHYVRSAVVIGMSGEIEESAGLALARRIHESFPDRPGTPPFIAEPSPITGRHMVFVDKPDRTQSQLAIASMGTYAHDPDHMALSLSVAIFGGTFTSRLMKEVRSKRGWSYSTSARTAIAEKRHAFSIWSFPAAKDTVPCLNLKLQLLEKFVSDGITARELAFIKKFLVRSFAFEIDTAHKRLGHKLDIELLGLPADYYSSYRERVEAIDLETANAAIKLRLSTEALVMVVVGTQGDLTAALQKDVSRVDSLTIVPFDRD